MTKKKDEKSPDERTHERTRAACVEIAEKLVPPTLDADSRADVIEGLASTIETAALNAQMQRVHRARRKG